MMQDGSMHDAGTWGTGLGYALMALFIIVVMGALIRYIFFD